MATRDDLPLKLSHYTTIPGFMGIVRTNRLWASNASFLNDRSELLHALDAAQTAIEKLTSETAMSHWRAMLERVVGELVDGKIPDTYVTCFCRNDDNLSQWRGYGGDVQGICVTFDRKKLTTILKKQKAKLYRVTYAKITTPSKLRKALKEELTDIASLEELLGSDEPHAKYADLFKRVSSLLPKFKHLGFQDEKEWRFVVQKSDANFKPEFRSSRNRVVPYMELGAAEEQLPIMSIRVGPGDDQDLTVQSLKPFLAAHGFDKVQIKKSEIPFRN